MILSVKQTVLQMTNGIDIDLLYFWNSEVSLLDIMKIFVNSKINISCWKFHYFRNVDDSFQAPGSYKAEDNGEHGDDSPVVAPPPPSRLNTSLGLPPQQFECEEVYEDQHQQWNCLHYQWHHGHHLNFIFLFFMEVLDTVFICSSVMLM